ncbi:MAG: DUF4397 domain-containing protein [Paraclostridium sp.]
MDCFAIKKDKVLVRLFNAIPVDENVDIYMDGKLIISNLSYKEFSPYTYIPIGLHKIDIYIVGTTTNPIIRTSLRLPGDQIFTIAITGNEKEETLLVIEDDADQVTSNDSSIGRIVNLAPNIPVADVLFNETPAVNNVEFRDETPYVYIPPGKYNVEVKTTQDGSYIAKSVFDFKVGKIYTTYIVGNPPNVELLNSIDGNTYACRN